MVMDSSSQKETWKNLSCANLVFSVSWSIISAIAVGAGLGYYLDLWLFDKVGVLFILGMLIGVVSGGYQACRLILKQESMDELSE